MLPSVTAMIAAKHNLGAGIAGHAGNGAGHRAISLAEQQFRNACGQSASRVFPRVCGQVAEWLKAHAWKVCNGESRSRVRIPLCPPRPYLAFAARIRPA